MTIHTFTKELTTLMFYSMTRNTLKGQKQLHSVHQAKDRDQGTVREEEGGTAEM